MPVPTPPNKDLFKVNRPKPRMRADSKKLDDEIKRITKDINTSVSDSVNVITKAKFIGASLDKEGTISAGTFVVIETAPRAKKTPFIPPEHLTHSPFRENSELRKLQYQLKKESEPKKPIKRSPKRKPAHNKTTGVK